MENGDLRELSVVVPVFNEAAALPEVLRNAGSVLQSLGVSCEIIVVDDGSTDGTWDRVRETDIPGVLVRGIRFSRNFGKESAISAGLRAAAGKAVAVIDGDGQHPVGLLAPMFESWRSNKALIVEAVKERRQEESFLRRLGARMFYRLFSRSTGLDLTDSTDYKLLDRTVVESYLALPERGRFFRGLTRWLGYAREELAFSPGARVSEEAGSRWSTGGLFDLARSALVSFTPFPMRLVTWLGVITLCASMLLGALTLWQKITGRAVEGFATVILVQLWIGSMLMISLGFIGEYLARVYEEVKGRPLYVIAERYDQPCSGIKHGPGGVEKIRKTA